LSPEASKLINDSLGIIESLVRMNKDSVQIDGIGSEGIMIKAANKLKESVQLHPDNPLIHYAYASCLHLALQNKTAEIEMRGCIQSHPDFILAKLAVEGWDRWNSMFALPPWGVNSKTVHPFISQIVKTATLISVRDGIVPRAAIFLRDVQGDFNNVLALESARISIASVISPFSDPDVVGIYTNIYDDPSNPYGVEILQIPWFPRGHRTRSAYEYLCIQEDIDFVIIDRNNIILLNKRLSIPMNMRITNNKILKRLQYADGVEFSDSAIEKAIKMHQQNFSISDVKF
jgi:hypothetical protein